MNRCTLLMMMLPPVTIGCGSKAPDTLSKNAAEADTLSSEPADQFPHDPDSVVVFSIDPAQHPRESGDTSTEQGNTQTLHGYDVLRKVEIADPAQQRRIVSAVNKGIRNGPKSGARCFVPRHAVRMTRNEETIDVVICFQCSWYQVFEAESEQPDKLKPISADAQATLNRILADAGVPRAAK